MPAFHRWSLRYSVDEKFFDRWTSQMAYVLGFTFADGSIYKTTLSWDIQTRDLNLLRKINKALDSTYPIVTTLRNSCRLRISNQMLIEGAIRRGLLPKKNMRKIFPNIPLRYKRHFIRGFLDGDGWIVNRTWKKESDLGFVSSGVHFLNQLKDEIKDQLGILGKIRQRNKITLKGVKSVTYILDYYSANAALVAKWLFGNLKDDDIYLDRKYIKYLEAERIFDTFLKNFNGKRRIQRESGMFIKDILYDLFKREGLNGMEIARKLSTSKSSVYRWLESTRVKYS